MSNQKQNQKELSFILGISLAALFKKAILCGPQRRQQMYSYLMRSGPPFAMITNPGAGPSQPRPAPVNDGQPLKALETDRLLMTYTEVGVKLLCRGFDLDSLADASIAIARERNLELPAQELHSNDSSLQTEGDSVQPAEAKRPRTS
jgi:hypothetical protein